MKRVGARSSGFVCSPRANIARNFLAPAKLPEGKKKKSFSWWIKLRICFTWRSAWSPVWACEAVAAPAGWECGSWAGVLGRCRVRSLGATRAFSQLFGDTKEENKVGANYVLRGLFLSFLCQEAGCCKTVFWARSSKPPGCRGGGQEQWGPHRRALTCRYALS